MTKLRRAAVVGIYDVRETIVILAPDDSVHELSGASAELARAVLAFVQEPRSRAEIVAHVEALTGGPLPDTTVVDDLLALFERTKVLVAASDAEPPRRSSQPRTRLVLGLCGAVASSLAPSLVSLLQQRGFELRVVATESALRFVQAEVLAALVHHPVRSSMWPDSSTASTGPTLPVPHINLAQWADAVLIWPATATTISRLATGDYSTLVSAVALSTRAPVVVVPSMNVEMYGQPAVQRNLAQLVADGIHVVHPGTGSELALAPDARTPALGPTPPHTVVAALLETVVRLARARRTGLDPRSSSGKPPRDAAEWDELFRSREDHELAWHREVLDDDLAALLEREAVPGRALLDIGTGLGVAAVAAARLGYRVVATDISEVALARARDRAGSAGSGAAIVWLRDDITNSHLHGEFSVLLDRGCLHLLAPEQIDAYASTLARLAAPGGVLILKTHAPAEGHSRGTIPYDAARIEGLLRAWFVLESDVPSTLPGPGSAPDARLFVLRRHTNANAGARGWRG
jgi:SAM-dependent methyltransferase/3-polyprenyl-4-hydroxybenzoate decarboxylase